MGFYRKRHLFNNLHIEPEPEYVYIHDLLELRKNLLTIIGLNNFPVVLTATFINICSLVPLLVTSDKETRKIKTSMTIRIVVK